MKLFDDIASYGKNFVERQRGVWDHEKWENFLMEVHNKGILITEEAGNSLGNMLESFKRFYMSISMDLRVFNQLSASAQGFVQKHKGVWDHNLWLDFLNDIQKKNVPLTGEISSSIGLVLESLRRIYFLIPHIQKPVQSLETTKQEQPKHEPLKTESPKAKAVSEEKPKTQVVKKKEGSVIVKLETPVMERPKTSVITKLPELTLPEKQMAEFTLIPVTLFPRIKKVSRRKFKKTVTLAKNKLSHRFLKKRKRKA
jgi:hypothetical protein